MLKIGVTKVIFDILSGIYSNQKFYPEDVHKGGLSQTIITKLEIYREIELTWG